MTPSLGRPGGVAVAVLVALAIGCGADPPPTLQIGIAASPSAEVLYLAQERGLFAAEGASVRLIEHTGASDVLRAFEREQVDGMATTLAEILDVRGGPPPQVVLVTDAAGGRSIVARSPLATTADLRGRRIAADPRSVSTYVLLETLARAGLSLADVTLVPANPMEMPRLLADGEVDAIVAGTPWSQEALRAGTGRALPEADAVRTLDVLALRRTVVESRRAEVAALLRAWDRALAISEADDSMRLMAARERLPLREFASSFHRAQLLRSDRQDALEAGALAQALAQVSRVLRENGQLSGPDQSTAVVAALPAGALAAKRR